MKKVCAFAPATVANFNVGFDVMGMALTSIGDKVEVEVNDLGEHRIVEIVSDIDLPYELEKNSCSVVIQEVQKKTNSNVFVDIKIKKGFNAGSGLGSSAASSVAAGYAYNKLLGSPLTDLELLYCCAEGERVACGSPILDNISPALYGGLVIIGDGKVYTLPPLQDMYLLAFFQKIEIKTEEARAILPKEIPITDAIAQIRNMASFMHALHTNNKELLQYAFQDRIAEPYRKNLIPNFDTFKQLATDNNAIAFGISGSGPTVFTIAETKQQIETIAQQYQEIVSDQNIDAMFIIESLGSNKGGAKICSYH